MNEWCLGYYGDGYNTIIVITACYLPDNRRRDYHYVMRNLFLWVPQLTRSEYHIILHGRFSTSPAYTEPDLSGITIVHTRAVLTQGIRAILAPIEARNVFPVVVFNSLVLSWEWESEDTSLTNGEIIFVEEFKPMWSRYLNVTDGQTDDLP